MNILDYDHEYNFRDRDVLLLGKATKDVAVSFDDFWDDTLSVPISELGDQQVKESAQNDTFERLHEYACNPDNFWPQVRERIENLTGTF